MADSDKIVSFRISGDTVTRVWASYRIDYDSERSLFDISGIDPAETDPETHYGGVVNQRPPNHDVHSPKQGYQTVVQVENASARDAVIADLDAEGISHSAAEDVSPAQDEKEALKAYGARNGVTAQEGMRWKRGLEDLDKGNISQKDFELGRNPNAGERFGPPKDTPGNGQ
jgi:hypothetical protein